MGRLNRLGILFASCIVVADLAQVVLVGKGLGALGGATIYSIVAWSCARDRLPGWWVAALMPLLPTALLLGLLGDEARAQLCDNGMIAVYTVQLALAATAILRLRQGSVRVVDDLS